MATSQRRKGSYHETKIVEWLKEIGFKAKKQPLSGQLGGEYRGDILIEIGGKELVVEVKYRDGGSFPSPFTVLDERDIAIYKRKTGEPKSIVIMDGDIFEKDIAPLLLGGGEKKQRLQRQLVGEDWEPSEALCHDINIRLEENINHDDETIGFRNYHNSKGSRFASVGTAYRNWCRNSVKFRKEAESRGKTIGGKQPKYRGQEPSFFSGIYNGISSD